MKPAVEDDSFIVNLAVGIYGDLSELFGDGLVRSYPQLSSATEAHLGDSLEPRPDPAAVLVAARLLHELITTRSKLPLARCSAWALVETYLLLNGRVVGADDDEVAALVEGLASGHLDAATALHALFSMVEPE